MAKGYAGKQIEVLKDNGAKLIIKNFDNSKFNNGADEFEVYATDVITVDDNYYGNADKTAADKAV